MPGRRILIAAMVLFAVAVVGAAGAYPRYNRIVFGAPPLALALIGLGMVAHLRGHDGRRSHRFWTASSLACAVLAAAALAIWVRPAIAGAVRKMPAMERAHVLLTLPTDRYRVELFEALRPVTLANCHMERFGDPHDGGYLMCGNLLGTVRTAYSYGIAGTDRWGCEIGQRLNVAVHQYDCFDLRQPPCGADVTRFHAECIGPSRTTDDAGRMFDTLERQLAVTSGGADRLVVKMDVEGAEWESLLGAPSSVLERIDQLAIELHGVGEARQVAVVRRLKEFFYVADLHFNNYVCAPRLDPFPSWAYNVLFVSKRITAVAPGPGPTGPHALQTPNEPSQPDCQLPTSRWSLGSLAPTLFYRP